MKFSQKRTFWDVQTPVHPFKGPLTPGVGVPYPNVPYNLQVVEVEVKNKQT